MTTPHACPHCGLSLSKPAPPTIWTPEKEAELRRYWAEDIPRPEIGKRLGCGASTVARKARELGLPHRMHILGGAAASWAADKIKILADMWANGYTAAQIAAAIGLSRNSVIGKATRMGLASRKPGLTKGQTPPVRITAKKKAATPSSVGARILRPGPSLPPLPKIQAPPLVPAGEAKIGVLLVDLEFERCKWPIGESPNGHTFCGRRAMGGLQPYCRGHARLAYVPARGRAA